MRLFVAIPLPDHTRDALAALVAGWQAQDWPVRWVAPQSLHLTLRFLGDVEPGTVQAIGGVLDGAVPGAGPIELVPQVIEFIPSRTRARVLWLAMEPVPGLELLVHRVEQGLAGLAVREVDGPFRPHVTLGRVPRGAGVSREAMEQVQAAVLPGGFLAERVVLYQSALDGGPPRYLERHVVPLGA